MKTAPTLSSSRNNDMTKKNFGSVAEAPAEAPRKGSSLRGNLKGGGRLSQTSE